MNVKKRFHTDLFFVLFLLFSCLYCVLPVKAERMAGSHHTLVVADEKHPNAAVMTYGLDKPASTAQYVLCKFAPILNTELLKDTTPADLAVHDLPGSVVGTYLIKNVKVTYELLPLLVGRNTEQHDGAALYRIKTEPPRPLVVRCGDGQVHNPHKPRTFLYQNTFENTQDKVELIGPNSALLTSSLLSHHVGVRTNGKITTGQEHAGSINIQFDDGEGDIMVTYAKDKEAALKILEATYFEKSYDSVKQYYSELLESKIQTPEKTLNQAFTSAIYNLEYAWLKPFGWVESVHHWQMMWHMQASGAAAWIGQADRAKDCIFAHAERQLTSGAAPQLTPAGDVHKEIFTGGSNQFYAWQIKQYWNYCGNTDDIKELEPILDRVVEQTYDEYDNDDDLLLRWAAQIGNQEDFVHTPYNGTSPTIEGINMMRTASEIAQVHGHHEKAESYRKQIDEALVKLKTQLWQDDLGRFGYYRDPLDVMHPDGQYHSLIYPVIYNILDPLDSWTSIRHLRDQLTGAGGEVYCSNNFPAHGATSGCQAGAAQQPWAAWGLSAVGLRNETYRPLKAVSKWVMNDTLRGSWPEIAEEPIPSYFSPPAGLFIQSVIEAVFGLQVEKQIEVLTVAPSFPDHWPKASLILPDFQAAYKKKGDVYKYVVGSRELLKRQLRWMLPPAEIKSVRVNGKKVAYNVSPGAGCVILSVDTEPSTETEFEARVKPFTSKAKYPASIAEGDTFEVTIDGCEIKKIDDRCGVLATSEHLSEAQLRCRLKEGLLKPYLPFGRLGQMNFSRRTFFALCEIKNGTTFWQPIDITVLPKYTASQAGELKVQGDGVSFDIIIRNNTFSSLRETAQLTVARQKFDFEIDIEPRTQETFSVRLPLTILSLFSVGDNRSELTLGDKGHLDLTIVARQLFESEPVLKTYSKERMVHVPLPESLLKKPRQLAGLRNSYGHDWLGWAKWVPHLDSLAGKDEVTIEQLPSVSFKNYQEQVVPISFKSGSPSFTLELDGQTYKKLYFLVIPYQENNDTFSPVARISVHSQDGEIFSRKLYTPGDLDWARVKHPILTTAMRSGRSDRFALLDILGPKTSQWEQCRPPAYPQPDFWATCLRYITSSAVMNVIEIDLGKPKKLKSLTITTIGVDSALGLVSVSAETAGNIKHLQGTKWMPPSKYLGSYTIFAFDDPASIENWVLEGDAFSVSSTPWLKETPTLNSVVTAGEKAAGKAISPDFVLSKDYDRMRFQYHGGLSNETNEQELLCIDLVDASNNERLHRYHVKASSPALRQGMIFIKQWAGRMVRLEIVDSNTNTAYAWMGIKKIELLPGN